MPPPTETPATERPDEFVWPPVSVDIQSEDAETVLDEAVGEVPAGTAGPTARSPAWRQALASMEQEFLRPTIHPIERQVHELGWSHEPREAACDRCGRSIGPHEEDEFGCSACRDSVSPIDRVVRLGEYTDPLDRWIWALKFQRLRTFGRYLGKELAAALEEAGALAAIPIGGIVIHPMPSSRRRLLQRGIDHARVIADSCASEFGIPTMRVLRRDHRPSQRAVVPSQRWANVSDAMGIPTRNQKELVGKRVILVDDVRTTGATGRAAALALKGQPDARYRPAPWGASEVWHAVLASAE